jgi:hypothetical protein
MHFILSRTRLLCGSALFRAVFCVRNECCETLISVEWFQFGISFEVQDIAECHGQQHLAKASGHDHAGP